MITIGLCLIYYGVALWCYQLYGWLAYDEWTAYPLMVAWKAAFGTLDVPAPVIGPLVTWFMDWPLSLSLIVLGCGLLATVTAVREYAKLRLQRLRLIWVGQHANAAGYEPWTVPRMIADFKKEVLDREKGDDRRIR